MAEYTLVIGNHELVADRLSLSFQAFATLRLPLGKKTFVPILHARVTVPKEKLIRILNVGRNIIL